MVISLRESLLEGWRVLNVPCEVEGKGGRSGLGAVCGIDGIVLTG